jgi:hypothetical protein
VYCFRGQCQRLGRREGYERHTMHIGLGRTVIAVTFAGSCREEGWCLDLILRREVVDGHQGIGERR